jgi:folate-binding protein YgfZ
VTVPSTPQATGARLPPGFAEDYDALRHGRAVVAAGRDVLRVSGPDAVEYLQGQCSQDIAALDAGASADALLLTPQGKLDALIRVTRLGEEDMVVDVDAGYGEVVATRLARFKLRVKADITALDWTCVAVRGPASADLQGGGAWRDVSLAIPVGWGGVVGVDLFGVRPTLNDPAPLASDAAWQSVRVEAGIPVMGAELDERTIAAEADLLDRCVSFTKGCYTGQELVARLDARGNKVARHLRAVVVGRSPGPAPTVRVGDEVVVGDRVVGRLTSVAWSGALDTPVALAYLHRDVEPPVPVAIRAGHGSVAPLPAEARLLPLTG